MEDLYEILEVHPKASAEVIKKAYQALARKYHPDLVEPSKRRWAEQRMQALNEAYATLIDPVKRARYDQDRVALQESPQPGRASAGSQSRPYAPPGAPPRTAGPGDNCFYHAGRRPSRACPNCRRLICAECCRPVGGTFLCPECASLDEFNRHFAEGQDFLASGRNYEAAKCFQQALQCDPSSGQAYYNLGLAYLNMASHPEAIEALSQACNLMPMVPEAHVALAKAFQGQGRMQAAIQEYQRALQLAPEDSASAYELGCLLFQLGSYKEAFPYIERAVQREPGNARGHFMLSKIFLSRGKAKEAQRELETALRLDGRLELRLNEFPLAFRAKLTLRRLFGGRG